MEIKLMSLNFHEICHGRSSFFFVIVYMWHQEGHFENEAVNPNHGVPNIFPKYLISVTFN